MFSRESAVNDVALTAVQFEVEKYDVTVLVWVGGNLGMSHWVQKSMPGPWRRKQVVVFPELFNRQQ